MRSPTDLLERARELADRLGQSILQWYVAVTRAKRSSISGSLAEAEQLAHDAFALGQGARQRDAALWLVIQLFVIRLLRGTLASAMASPIHPGDIWTPDSGVAARPSRSVPLLLEAVQVATACEAGRSQDVRECFDALMKDELRDLPYDWMALVIPCLASVACVHLRDVPRAQTLYAMLEPYAEQFVDSGPSWFGTTSHHLANLATTLGRDEEADAHFIDATDAYTTLGAEAWLIRARREWARMLIAPAPGKTCSAPKSFSATCSQPRRTTGSPNSRAQQHRFSGRRIEPPSRRPLKERSGRRKLCRNIAAAASVRSAAICLKRSRNVCTTFSEDGAERLRSRRRSERTRP